MVIPESTGDEHYSIVKVLFLVAEYLRDDPHTLHAANGMLNQNPGS